MGHCASGGGLGGRLGSGWSVGSNCGRSNQDSTGSRKGKRQTGSLPMFCTLLGMNLSGKAAAMSLPTCSTVIITASKTSPRSPFILRYKNVNKSPMCSSCLWANVSGPVGIVVSDMERGSASHAGNGQVDVARGRINGDGVRLMPNGVVAQLAKVSVGLVEDRNASPAADKHQVCWHRRLQMHHLHQIGRRGQQGLLGLRLFRPRLPGRSEERRGGKESR